MNSGLSVSWQFSLLISFELLTIPSPTTLLPFRHARFHTLPRFESSSWLLHRPSAEGGLTWSGHHRADCVQSRVRQFLGSSPTGLAESSSPIGYGLVIRLRLLSTLSRDNAVTTFDYRLVTVAWTGLSPDNSNAFTGALRTVIADRPPHTTSACGSALGGSTKRSKFRPE